MTVPFYAQDAREIMLEAQERGPREFSEDYMEHLLKGCLVGIQMAADCGLPEYVFHTPFSADGDCTAQTTIVGKLRSANFNIVPIVYQAGEYRLLKFHIQWVSE